MQTNKIRIISKEELQEVNPQLLAIFGSPNKIASGSVVEYEDGKKNYHIQLAGWNPYKQLTLLKKIGKRVKKVWEADEVYYLGFKIA